MSTSFSVWLQKEVFFCLRLTTPGTVSFSKSSFLPSTSIVQVLWNCKALNVHLAGKSTDKESTSHSNSIHCRAIYVTWWVHELTKGSAVVIIKGESQISGSLITSGTFASYVDRQRFKACNFSSNILTKAELFLNLYNINRGQEWMKRCKASDWINNCYNVITCSCFQYIAYSKAHPRTFYKH